MGTNYYWHETARCPHCGQATSEKKHIGKSSAGWCFSLRVYPDEGIHDLPDWEERFDVDGSYIQDEYHDIISSQEMMEIITERSAFREWDEVRTIPASSRYGSWTDFHRINYSVEGPNGLLRHRVGEYCSRHGDGTWDCMVGEFS